LVSTRLEFATTPRLIIFRVARRAINLASLDSLKYIYFHHQRSDFAPEELQEPTLLRVRDIFSSQRQPM
jgi:hypothetical protein